MAQGQQFLPVNVDINKSILKRQTEITFQFFSYNIYDHIFLSVFQNKTELVKNVLFYLPQIKKWLCRVYRISRCELTQHAFSSLNAFLGILTKKTTGGK